MGMRSPRSPANRGWGCGWTPYHYPRQIGVGDGDGDWGTVSFSILMSESELHRTWRLIGARYLWQASLQVALQACQ
jgi:hypothetical protein